ncbi:MAG: MarR family transcriptional regulator [Sphingomonas sp.]|uniref:MarR family winged helix-turn-helix transcriptional regulator n=1 Tax=Sphingomonas sp. TaxID=28214 RepID=UPI0035A8EB79|nr:MarR family transcriptional regulator [Sphingomonas sp.]
MTATPPNDPLTFEFFNEIGIIDQLSGTIFERALPARMTRAQFTVLNHFVRLGHHERSPAQLANAFQVTRPTITSTLARMARDGLVTIRDDPADGRAKLVSLTDKGRSARESALGAVTPLLPLLEAVIDPQELALVLPVLRRVRIALDAARDPVPNHAPDTSNP